MFPRFLPVFLLPLLIATGCSRDPLDVDVSNVRAREVSLMRLDQDLFGLQPAGFDANSAGLQNKYGPFYDHYIMGFIAKRGTADSGYRRSVLSFVSDPDIKACQQEVQNMYPDQKLLQLMPEVNRCVKRFKYHFPEKKQPLRLVTCVSGWNYAFAYMDSTISLSLDMYLGENSKFYEMLQYPQYQRKKMGPDYLLPDLARGWILTEFDKVPAENSLVYHCLFYGKMYYAVNALLPDTHDSLLIGYSGKQLAYCRQYEKQLWSYFAEKNRLYEENLETVRELTGEGPFTGAISKECPPRIAMWVGLQIIRSYMDRHPEVSLAALMADQNAPKLLAASKYRP